MGPTGCITKKTGNELMVAQMWDAVIRRRKEVVGSLMGPTGRITKTWRRTNIGEAVIGVRSGGNADGTHWSHHKSLAANR